LKRPGGSLAAFLSAALSLVSLGLGLAILSAVRGADPGDLAAGETMRALGQHIPLLLTAEAVKAALALSGALAMLSLRKRLTEAQSPLRVWSTTGVGLAGSGLLLASAAAGAQAAFEPAMADVLAKAAVQFGALSVVATGLWALLSGVMLLGDPFRARALGLIGVGLGVASAPMPFFPIAGMAVFVFSLAWWILLGLRLRDPR
jgi:hypothetical protein